MKTLSGFAKRKPQAVLLAVALCARATPGSSSIPTTMGNDQSPMRAILFTDISLLVDVRDPNVADS